MKHLFNVCERVPSVIWWKIFEDLRTMRSLLLKAVLVVTGRHSKEHGIAAFLFAKRVLALRKSSGLLFCALYLKQCSACLATAYGGVPQQPARLPVFVKLNKKGYPLIIPSFHRKMIAKGDGKADLLVRLYMSWFSLSKLVKLAKPVTRHTFDSIITPVADRERVLRLRSEMEKSIPSLISRYLPFLPTVPLNTGPVWEPSWKSIPTNYGKMVAQWLGPKVPVKWKSALKRSNTVFHGLLFEWWSFILFHENNPPLIIGFTSAPLFIRDRVLYALDPNNEWWAKASHEFFYDKLRTKVSGHHNTLV